MFHPATIAEYCGWSLDYAERVDLGGASAVAAVWRAAAAIELGICDVVVVTCTGRPEARAAHRLAPGTGTHGQRVELDVGFAPVRVRGPVRRHPTERRLRVLRLALPRVVRQRAGRSSRPRQDRRGSTDERVHEPRCRVLRQADHPEDVLASRLIADPLHILEIVMLCHGGGSVVIASKERAQRCPKRPVFLTGCGEHLAHKTPTYSVDEIPRTPISVRRRSRVRDERHPPRGHRHAAALRLLHDHRSAHHRAVGFLCARRGHWRVRT